MCLNSYFSVYVLCVLFADGAPDGRCSSSIQCQDAHSTCTENVCRCNTGYTNINGKCTEGRLMKADSRFYIGSDKRQKDCLWKHRTHYRLENGSLGFIETLHKQ